MNSHRAAARSQYQARQVLGGGDIQWDAPEVRAVPPSRKQSNRFEP
jgi:hypothetical protein